MGLARGGDGVSAEVQAIFSQVHPVFMLPPLAASIFGGVLAGGANPTAGFLHVLAIFFAVYTAHVKDGYVDFYVRDEDASHPVTATGCRRLLVGATAGFAIAVLGLWWVAGVGAAVLTVPCWIIGYAHAPQLDTHPLGATLGYPTGIALAIVGGAYVQSAHLTGRVAGFAAVFLVVLAGIKVIDDAQDYDYDRRIAKRTVPVVLGRPQARRVGFATILGGLALTVGLTLVKLFPPGAVLAVVVFGAVAAMATRAQPTVATMLLVRGAYLFLAILLVAVEFLPDSLGG